MIEYHNKNIDYGYIVVPDEPEEGNEKADKLVQILNKGGRVVSAVATGNKVHYIVATFLMDIGEEELMQLMEDNIKGSAEKLGNE